MSIELKNELSQNEVIFMRRMEESILPNRKNVDVRLLQEVGALIGIRVNISCRTCASKGGTDMLNAYGQLKPAWDKYNEPFTKEEIYTKFEETILNDAIIKEPLKKTRSKKV